MNSLRVDATIRPVHPSIRSKSYLDELAHGLRLPRDVRNHLHQRLGLPELTR